MADLPPGESCTALVVGAGPGGYVCAIRLGQLGVDTILVDAGTIGGTCLNVGCIPSKALIHEAAEFATVAAAVAEARFGLDGAKVAADMPATTATVSGVVERLTGGVTSLVKQAGVRSITGRAEIVDGKTVRVTSGDESPDDGTIEIRCNHLVIATGSKPAGLPMLPFDGERVISSTEALFLGELPARLAVVGAGYIGLELGTAFAKLGTEVTVVELLDRILPQYDAQLTKPVAARLRELGVDVRLETSITDVDLDGFDKVLVTVGRVPVTDGWGLETLGLDRDGAYLAVDDEGRTSMRGVWAIGDITGEPMLAHRAMAQGEDVAEVIAEPEQRRALPNRVIPAVCYTDPEIVTAGLSPDDAAEAGIETIVGVGNLAGNGRALTLGRRDGLVRVVARRDNHTVVGLQAVGVEVSEFATTFAMALELGCVLEDVATVVPAHPTLGEAMQEAVFTALERPLHS